MENALLSLLTLPPAGTIGLTRQLTDQIRALIAEGQLAAGETLPSSRRLAQHLGIARNTVTQAIDQLAAEGYLEVLPNRRPRVTVNTSLSGGRPNKSQHLASPSQPRPSLWARQLAELSWPPPARSPQPRAFQAGLADEREFPHAVWGRCLRLAASRGSDRRRQDSNDPSLQEALLAYLAKRRGIHAKPDQIILLPSAQAGLNMIARTMIDPGDVAWIESPGYGGAYSALSFAGARITGIPLDASGLMIAKDGCSPRLIFTTPSHQYPTGRLMPITRRLDLLTYAGAVNSVIVEDDYDGDFHYEGSPVAALAGIAPEGPVLYVGTFAKVMSADTRVGYVVVPRSLLPSFRLAQRHLGLFVPAAMQMALAEFIASGELLTHVRRMTRLYRERRDHLAKEIKARAGAHFSVEIPAGGMQLLARCSDKRDDVALCRKLSDKGVVARPLSEMVYHTGDERGIFLGFSAWDEEEITRGMTVIGQVVG